MTKGPTVTKSEAVKKEPGNRVANAYLRSYFPNDRNENETYFQPAVERDFDQNFINADNLGFQLDLNLFTDGLKARRNPYE